MTSPLRLGMVGGGPGAFIGAVHRMAARLDDSFQLVAGAVSSQPQRAIEGGVALGLARDRAYPTWQEMLHGETARPTGDRIDAVTIVTPNASHHEIARAFIEARIPVIIDKPMTTTVAHAHDLGTLAATNGVPVAVTYNYSGYPMVRHARAQVAAGALGRIRKVVVEYHQGWLSESLEQTGHKQASWRTDPVQAGAGAIGDIGTHAHQLACYVTGSRMTDVSAHLRTFVEGRRVDDDASVFAKFENGAQCVLLASQVCTGSRNDLTLRVWGEKGGLAWRQEQPESLMFLDASCATRTVHRGMHGLGQEPDNATRLPSGHPEGFIEAFANIYRGFAAALRAGRDDPQVFGYPGIQDGIEGVRFIHAVLTSHAQGGAWTPV